MSWLRPARSADRRLTIVATFAPLSPEGIGTCMVDIEGDDIRVSEGLTALAGAVATMIARAPAHEHSSHCYEFGEQVAAALEQEKRREAAR